MQNLSLSARIVLGLSTTLLIFAWFYYQEEFAIPKKTPTLVSPVTAGEAVAYFAGGCFWCTEADFEKVPGVTEVISGYAGGHLEHPSYEDVTKETSGHRETVEVRYDPALVSYRALVEYFFAHVDPVDAGGQFIDRGESYTSAIFYKTKEEELVTRDVVEKLSKSRAYERSIVTVLLPFTGFYPAEEYHQDYSTKNPTRYAYYRSGSGRDARLRDLCRSREEHGLSCGLPADTGAQASKEKWTTFVKPSDDMLRRTLTALQYKVTQRDETEPAFNNPYDKNYAEGIYVDIVSGEPLFLSKDKYDSGTGWPSFVKPITPDAVVLKESKAFFITRIEVRSRYGDSHLGHVFSDGPTDRGGKRYCMNSAALRFVPKTDMEKEGYAHFLPTIEE